MHNPKRHFLQSVEEEIESSLNWDQETSFSAEPTLFAAARHLCLANGAKRARPKLVYFLSQSLGIDRDLLVDVAVTSEFIHNASLLHDDVIDNGVIRRGNPTVNVVWDELTAVLAGDILLSESIRRLINCPRVIAQEALQLVSDMTKATMLEAHVRNKTNISIDQWRYIANGKTAAMFSWCGRSVGHLARSEKITQCFGQFGTHFGIAFQMADDLIDIFPLESGKTPFADLQNRNPSYPMIIAQQLSSSFSSDLSTAWQQESLSEADVANLGKDILSTGAADYTYEQIQKEIQLAIEALDEFIDLPGCKIVVEWALGMCYRFQKSEAV